MHKRVFIQTAAALALAVGFTTAQAQSVTPIKFLLHWRFEGPANLGSTVVSPVASDGALFALSLEGAVFRSGDAGAHWQAILTPDMAGTVLTQLAMLPAAQSYPQAAFVVSASHQLYRLVPGEASGKPSPIAVSSYGVQRVAIIGSAVFAAAGDGLWRSDDGGLSWRRVLEGWSDGGGWAGVASQPGMV